MALNVRWVRIRSWHIVRYPGRGFTLEHYTTLCGRVAPGPELDERPGNEATCESCLRIGGPK